jgi:hypothetical protein
MKMKKKLIALALLASIGSSVFASQVKKDEEFTAQYRRQVLQSVILGKNQVMTEGNEVSSVVGTTALVTAGAFAAGGALTGSAIGASAANGLVVGIAAGLIVGGIAAAANASTISCMDEATNNGEKMECASTSFAHTNQLIGQAIQGYVVPLNEDNTRQVIGAFWEDTPVTQKLIDGTPVIKFATLGIDSVPSVITIAGKFEGEEYATKYPESLGYSWAIKSVQKYNKPVVVRNQLDKDEWSKRVAPFLNDPSNFAKS